jgi:hypothetical protein
MSSWFERNRHRYPPDWPDISQAVREDAGQRCEQCGVPNGAYICRYTDGSWSEIPANAVGVTRELGIRVTRVVLTVAHIGAPREDGSPGDKHDKSDCRRQNLRAWCQRCHLRFDMDDHVRNAAETRRRRKIEAGQLPLIEVPA